MAIIDRPLHADRGTKIDLTAMPAEGVARCRAAWRRFAGRATCVVHGDPNTGNILVTDDRVAQASAAWEAAVCWGDRYAIDRLAEVRPV